MEREFAVEYAAPDLGEPSAALLLHPSDLRALCLPGEALLVLQARLPLFLGSAWPSKRVPAGSVRLPCSSAAAASAAASA